MSDPSKDTVIEPRTGSLFVDSVAVELKATGTVSAAVVTTVSTLEHVWVVVGAPARALPRWLDLLRYFFPHEWRDRIELIYGDIVEMKGKDSPGWIIFAAVVCDLAFTFIRLCWRLVLDILM